MWSSAAATVSAATGPGWVQSKHVQGAPGLVSAGARVMVGRDGAEVVKGGVGRGSREDQRGGRQQGDSCQGVKAWRRQAEGEQDMRHQGAQVKLLDFQPPPPPHCSPIALINACPLTTCPLAVSPPYCVPYRSSGRNEFKTTLQ